MVKASSQPRSEHQLPLREVENHNALPLYKALEFQGTSQRIEKACSEPEDLKQDTLDTVVDGNTLREIIPTLTLIQQKPQTRGLKGYGSSSSSPPTTQRSTPMEHGQQEVQPRITVGRTWSKFAEDMSQRDTLQGSYYNHQRLESQQAVQTPGGEGNQHNGKSSQYPSYSRIAEQDRA
ncbi:hypothetical protein O181_023467 [Austropuccinia psidii MF-1]|uniref:Uncharacterized protein n=1 Tax=Austropuccinia psidii MF-1 TaxID=1389203 RepID=A0A9Q3CJK4_9BASI|nr:hypothetical protein [Austropuccinia psidii MF-1]